MRALYFKFSENFRFFRIEEESIGEHLGLEMHNLYEYNDYDKQYRKLDISKILESVSFNITLIEEMSAWIEAYSYPKVTMWNTTWLKVHHSSNYTMFYNRNDVMTPEESIFNQTCQETLFKSTQCLIFDRAENKLVNFANIHTVEVDHLPPMAVISIRFYHDRRHAFVLNAQNLT